MDADLEKSLLQLWSRKLARIFGNARKTLESEKRRILSEMNGRGVLNSGMTGTAISHAIVDSQNNVLSESLEALDGLVDLLHAMPSQSFQDQVNTELLRYFAPKETLKYFLESVPRGLYSHLSAERKVDLKNPFDEQERIAQHDIGTFWFEKKLATDLSEKKTERLEIDEIKHPGEAVLKINGSTVILPKNLVGHKSDMESYLAKHPYKKNVFVMIRCQSADHLIVNPVSVLIQAAGFHPIVAEDEKVTTEINNPLAALICCKHGIAIFDDPATEGQAEINPNVTAEAVLMYMQRKNLLILRSENIPVSAIPFDLKNLLLDSYNPKAVASTIKTPVEAFLASLSDDPE